MYLADALLRSTSKDASLLRLRTELEDSELFAVEASAMTLCHELRLESAGQMERIAAILCTQPRKVFAEVAMTSLRPLLQRTMHLPQESADEITTRFPRIGVLMNPNGTSMTLTIAWINGQMPHKKWSDDWKAHVVGVAGWHSELSAAKPFLPNSPTAMLASAFQIPEVDFFIRVFEQSGQSQEDAVRMAWMTNRLLALGGEPDHEAVGYDGILRNVVIATALALGALLLIEAPELARNRRPRIKSVGGARRSQSTVRPVDDRLSIVTLRFTDPELQRWYETPANAERRARRTAARHLVRGHVFATRWGGIAWRKPHWRGDPSRKTLHRVI